MKIYRRYFPCWKGTKKLILRLLETTRQGVAEICNALKEKVVANLTALGFDVNATASDNLKSLESAIKTNPSFDDYCFNPSSMGAIIFALGKHASSNKESVTQLLKLLTLNAWALLFKMGYELDKSEAENIKIL